ncbi:MAG: hypothetical protein Q4F57_02525 [Weeksellaceae bacterium]|nr:hypothetical protein [Weeksellaceae bacterium]
MGYVIRSVDDALAEHIFEINGVAAVRNYTAQVNGNRLKITSTENAALSLLEVDVQELEIDGRIYNNATDAQRALNSIIYADLPIVVLTREEKEKLILKLPPTHPEAQHLLRADGTRVENTDITPGLDVRMSNLVDLYAEDDPEDPATVGIARKLNVPTAGLNENLRPTPNRQEITDSVGGMANENYGNGGVSIGGYENKITTQGKGSVNISGQQNEASGCMNVIFGGILLKTKTFIEYAFGQANEEHPVYSHEQWDDRDVLLSVGGGNVKSKPSGLMPGHKTYTADSRLNLFTHWKYGVWRWKMRGTLSNAPKELLQQGMHGVDDAGLLHYHDGKSWVKYALDHDGVELHGGFDSGNPVKGNFEKK